jgi:hypothetical protein
MTEQSFPPRPSTATCPAVSAAALPAALYQGLYQAQNAPERPETGGPVPKAPPSDEAFLDLYEVAGKVLARPGETVRSIFVSILVDGPDGDQGRWIVSPADAYEAALRIVDRQIHEVLDAT